MQNNVQKTFHNTTYCIQSVHSEKKVKIKRFFKCLCDEYYIKHILINTEISYVLHILVARHRESFNFVRAWDESKFDSTAQVLVPVSILKVVRGIFRRFHVSVRIWWSVKQFGQDLRFNKTEIDNVYSTHRPSTCGCRRLSNSVS